MSRDLVRLIRNSLGAGVLAALVVLAGAAGVEQARSQAADPAQPSLADVLGAPGGVVAEAAASLAPDALVADAPPPPGWDMSNIDHPRVDYWIGRFQTDKRDDFEMFLKRKGRYASFISEALGKRGMPQDLIYLAMVESGFHPKAYSRAHASGMWQFIKGTATRYGLDINRAVDERNDPVKATDAALRYLSDLHRRFGSWYLAAAAYNTGENRIERIMRRELGRRNGTDSDYYRIWDHLPSETRDYVPLMIAAARISKEPARYGFDVEPFSPWQYDHVTARPATPLKTLAQNAGTTVEAIKQLNPHLKLARTRNDMTTKIRVPVKAKPVEVLTAD